MIYLESRSDWTVIDRSEERIGQFATRSRAAQFARRETLCTGREHRYILTTCYRNLRPRVCWYVYLYMGKRDAQFRAWGEE